MTKSGAAFGDLETQSAFMMPRDKTFEPKLAGLAEEVRADFTLLKGAEENPLRADGQDGVCASKAEVGADRRRRCAPPEQLAWNLLLRSGVCVAGWRKPC
jgi:hypothetical protein